MSRHHLQRIETPTGTVWRAVVDLGTDPATGKRRQKRVSSRISQKDCEKKVAKVVTEAAAGKVTASSALLVDVFLDQWLDAIRQTVRPTSHDRYARALTVDVRPAIGRKRIDKVHPIDIQKILTGASKRGLAPATVDHLRTVLHRAFRQAVRWRLIAFNPVDEVDPPKVPRVEMNAWAPAEAAIVLATAEGDDYEALWRLAITTGLRRGEMLGLRWTDVDWERSTITIRQTLVRGPGGALIPSEPKSERGRRTIALSMIDLRLLRQQQTRQKEWRMAAARWEESGLVFTSMSGDALSPSTLQRSYEALVKRAGVRRIRFHDLRHTAASIMVEANEHPRVMMERMGHSSIEMTMEHYAHVNSDMQKLAAERVSDLLKKIS